MDNQLDGVVCTFSGAPFDVRAPYESRILIEDIAHALSQTSRFGGHTLRYYSVAQHSVVVCDLCSNTAGLQGLLHDAAEAYLVDLPTPIKNLCPEYAVWEKNILGAIGKTFGANLQDIHPLVKLADQIAFSWEVKSLISPNVSTWWQGIQAPRGYIPKDILESWTPKVAEETFLNRFRCFMEDLK